MTIVNRSMFPLQTGFSQIGKMQQRFSQLQGQLATGQKASTLSELGSDRYVDLSLRSRLGRIEGYQNNIDTVNLRLGVLDQTLSRLDVIEGDARTAVTPGGYGTGKLNFGTAPALAKSRLDEVLDLLNTDVDGRYMFAGSKTETKPVGSADALLEGTGGKAGFRQVASERAAADLGSDGLGRLALGGAAATVTLSEDGDHPFGLKLSTLTTSSAGIALTQPAGAAAQSLAVTFNANPIAGEGVSIGLTLPDGSERGITLKAVAGTPAQGEFQIGADANATAANFSAALSGALTTMGKTELAAASAYAAADNFFNGQGDPVLRVDGPPFAAATALVSADPATTAIWYAGEDSADPRSTVRAKIDEQTAVSYGVQANESGPLQLVRSLAVLAVQTFPVADGSADARFDAVAARNISRLSEGHNSEPGSIEMMNVELGNTAAAANNVAERHTVHKSQLDGLLGDLETAPKEDVAMELLALQTRLQASYEATSMISQLSFVNYMR